jgi:hypothetical protein
MHQHEKVAAHTAHVLGGDGKHGAGGYRSVRGTPSGPEHRDAGR